ncbi:hypothetical protein BT93_G0645 [Corymbia citriodora subsp. variegata]|nr:hypothetical protein BT93_G0645 [Corymbia citriodora subsp. variegata]
MIARAEDDGKLVFQDGSSIYADVIIHCTGYSYHFPFLKMKGLISVDNNRVGPLYKHVFPTCLVPRLSFICIPYLAFPAQPSELQSKWVAKVLSGEVVLPSEEEMMSSVQEHYQRVEELGWPKHHTHRLEIGKVGTDLSFLSSFCYTYSTNWTPKKIKNIKCFVDYY